MAFDFAQIGCCDAKSGVRRDGSVMSADAVGCAVGMASAGVRMRCASSGQQAMSDETRSCFQDVFRERMRVCAAHDGVGDGVVCIPRATTPGSRCGRAGTFVLQKVLTVEKTVIRFRPADQSCGSE